MYPNVWVRSRLMMRISKIYLFCAILLEALLVYINVVTESEIWWCSITGLSLLYGYVVIRFAILGKSGYRMKTILLTLIAILMVIAIDFVVGYRGWSVNYALPAGILLIDAGILLLMIINRRNWQSYLMWQILMILCSVIPLVLWHLGIETVRILSILPRAPQLRGELTENDEYDYRGGHTFDKADRVEISYKDKETVLPTCIGRAKGSKYKQSR